MALKMLIRVVSSEAQERALLEDNFWQIGCHGFIEQLWGLKTKNLVVELLEEQDN